MSTCETGHNARVGGPLEEWEKIVVKYYPLVFTRNHRKLELKEASQARNRDREGCGPLATLAVDSNVQAETDGEPGPKKWMETEEDGSVMLYSP